MVRLYGGELTTLDSRKVSIKIRSSMIYIPLVIYVIFCLYPLYFTINTSLQEHAEIFSIPPKVIFKPTLKSYVKVLTMYGFTDFMINSLVAVTSSVALAMTLGVPCAYVLSRYDIPRKRDIAYNILTFRFLPPIAIAIPLYLYYIKIKMYDTVAGLSLIYVVMNLPFTVWLTRGFFLAIPKELEEAAELDGCSKLGVFLRITLPLSLYGLASTALLCFILTWNEFLLALILTGMSARTLPVQSLKFAEAMGLDWGALCAAATIILLPPIAMGIFLRKYIIRGLTFGAIKG